jgi:protein-tyrosine phosphatase
MTLTRDWLPIITAANVIREQIEFPLDVTNFTLAGQAQQFSNKPGSQGIFFILAVCTGNVCRSPAVERLLAQQLGPTVSISSTGTYALVGHPISEPMARLLHSTGAEHRDFAARHLTEKLVKEADLVLALTRAQRSLVVDLWPPAVSRTFTLRQFARLLQHIDRSSRQNGPPASGYVLRCR